MEKVRISLTEFQMVYILFPSGRELNFPLLEHGVDSVTHFQRKEHQRGKQKLYNEGDHFQQVVKVDTISDKSCSCHVLPDVA